MYLGHEGKPCPKNHAMVFDDNKDNLLESIDLSWEEEEEEDPEAAREDDMIEENVDENVLVFVHTTGVFNSA
jgi:hypothetical protein